MKRVFGLLIVVVLLATTLPAGATVVTFDDLDGDWAQIPAGYAGLDWSGYCVDGSLPQYAGTGYDTGRISSPRVATNRWGANLEVTAADPFDFTGAYFTAVWNDGLIIEINASLDGFTRYHTTVTVNTTAPTWVSLNWTGVDYLWFMTHDGTPNPDIAHLGLGFAFVVDNFTYNRTTIPAPGAVLLGSMGAGLVSWLRRRRAL